MFDGTLGSLQSPSTKLVVVEDYMISRKATVVICAITCVGTLSAVAYRSSQPDAKAATKDLVSTTSERVPRHSAPRALDLDQGASEPAEAADPAVVAEAVPLDPGAGTTALPQSESEHGAILQAKFDMEARSRGMVEVERAIVSQLDRLRLSGVRMESVECRSTRCKLVAIFQDATSDGSFFSSLFNPKETTPQAAMVAKFGFYVTEREAMADNTVRATVYLHSEDTMENFR
jgi:hypothetical protein